MAKDLGISLEQVFGVFSASLFVGGVSAPIIGKQMDRIGAATVLATAALGVVGMAAFASVAMTTRRDLVAAE